MLLEVAIHFHLVLSSGSILVNFLWSSERTLNIFLSLPHLWECPVDRSESRSEPTRQMRQAKPLPLDSSLARYIFSRQELVFIHEKLQACQSCNFPQKSVGRTKGRQEM